MREKGKQGRMDERSSGTPEQAPSKPSIREPAPIYDDESFARRTGEIIARAVRAARKA
jgi:hypothetical protein